LEEFFGRYLGLGAFGELNNAFNTPSTFGAVKCQNCVVGITGSDVYELRKKERWSVLLGEGFKAHLTIG
jgi:hypothetical protein